MADHPFYEIWNFIYRLSPDQWSALAAWVGSIGTLAAVIISLKASSEARKNSEPKIIVKYNLDREAYSKGAMPKGYTFKAINSGYVPVVLSEFYLSVPRAAVKMGTRKKRTLYRLTRKQGIWRPYGIDLELPRLVGPAEEAKCFIPYTELSTLFENERRKDGALLIATFADNLGRTYTCSIFMKPYSKHLTD